MLIVSSGLLVQKNVSSLSDLTDFATCAFRVTYQYQDLNYHQLTYKETILGRKKFSLREQRFGLGHCLRANLGNNWGCNLLGDFSNFLLIQLCRDLSRNVARKIAGWGGGALKE